MKRRITCVLLAAALILGLCGCGTKKTSSSTGTNRPGASSTQKPTTSQKPDKTPDNGVTEVPGEHGDTDGPDDSKDMGGGTGTDTEKDRPEDRTDEEGELSDEVGDIIDGQLPEAEDGKSEVDENGVLVGDEAENELARSRAVTRK